MKVGLLLFLSLLSDCTAAYRVCSRKHKLEVGRTGFAIVAQSNRSRNSSSRFFWALGGTDGEFETYDDLQSFDTFKQEFKDESMSLPHSEFIQSSVQRISEKEYLLMPAETMAEFWVWDESAMSTATHVSFPQIGLSDYCLMHSATHHTAILTGGLIDGEETPSSDWFTLDTSNTSDLVWRQSDSALPFLRYGHSCCIISGIPVIYGGYDSTETEYPKKTVFTYNFDDETWSEIGRKTRGKSTYYRTAFGMCVTEYSEHFNQSDWNNRAYLLGGKVNRSGVNTAVIKASFKDESRSVLKFDEGRKSSTGFRTESKHWRPAGLLKDGVAWVVGGRNKNGNPSKRAEEIEVSCGPKFRLVRNPMNDWFGIPYYVLYPLGMIFSLFFAAAKNDNDPVGFPVDPVRRPNTSVTIPSFGRSVELTTMSARAKTHEQTARMELTKMYDDTIMDCLTNNSTIKLPEELALIIYGYAGPLEMDDVTFGRDYREKCSWYCCCFRTYSYCSFILCSTLSCCAWFGELCLCTRDCHASRVFLRFLLNAACTIVCIYEFALFTMNYKSDWQRINALWLVFMSHPFLKMGVEWRYSVYDLFKNDGISMWNVVLQILIFLLVFAVSIPVSIAGVIVFAPFPIVSLFIAAFVTDGFDEREIESRSQRSLVWFLFIVSCRNSFLAFAVFSLGTNWADCFVYAVKGGDCDSWKLDWSYPPTWLFLLGWIL